jgi:hypothetical protein
MHMTRRAALAASLALIAGGALAQSHQPYAGLQSRAIKALSAEQIADLRAGRGMSLALPAELNGYPGPLHVIELADKLALSADQRMRMQALFEQMKQEAIGIGHRLIAQEGELDRLFAERKITAASLAASTAAIGQTQAALRATHLRYHLLTADILTPAQIQITPNCAAMPAIRSRCRIIRVAITDSWGWSRLLQKSDRLRSAVIEHGCSERATEHRGGVDVHPVAPQIGLPAAQRRMSMHDETAVVARIRQKRLAHPNQIMPVLCIERP